MKKYRWVAISVALWLNTAMGAAAQADKSGHYLFAWSGATGENGEDFIAVIDADPKSARYGELVTSVSSGIATQQVHHTEYWMPDSAQLFANDHMSGETVVFDLKDPLLPRIRARFHNLAGFSHPHSFLRLPNGHVMASFQFAGELSHASMTMSDPAAQQGVHGGIVEIDEDGHAVRAASTADRQHASDPLMAYSLLPLPDIDRVLVTNSGMRDIEPNGHTIQLFRLSDLKLLATESLDPGSGHYGELNPEEARRGPDGDVYVQTLGCGIERVSKLTTDHPESHLVYQFPGYLCGVPSVVGRFWIQPVQILHAVIVVDLTAAGGPKEVSRAALDGAILPHWSAYDSRTHRLAVSGYGESRFYLLTFDPDSGKIAVDRAFKDHSGRPGFDTGPRNWPHGWKGGAQVHGIVFSGT
jgi:hypothetical protein